MSGNESFTGERTMTPGLKSLILGAACAFLISASVSARTLEVGPEKLYEAPSEAISAAEDGDTIRIDAAVYKNDWAKIRADNLTIEAVGGEAVLASFGMIPNRKAIWVVKGNNIRIENVEFRGARVRDRNGAGIRQEGNGLVLRRCSFFNNENGILGGSGDCVIDIQHCEFGYNSLHASPGTHNLYIGHCRKLIFKYNYSHHAKVCHLLKSRAKENIIMCNRLSDEEYGSSSYVINLPNGGRAVIAGNLIHQGPRCQNRTVVAYGEEGTQQEGNALWFAHNTVINDGERGRPTFISINKLPEGFKPVLANNIFVGKGQVTNWSPAVLRGNFTGAVADAGFVNRNRWNLRLREDSPCVDAGVSIQNIVGGMDIALTRQYLHPMWLELRVSDDKPDIGAYEYSE